MNSGLLVVLVGPPGCGKSTYAEHLRDYYKFELISSDTIREEIFNDINDQTNNAQVFAILHDRMREALGRTNVVIDATSCRKESRMELITYASDNLRYAIAAITRVSLGECLLRNENRERHVPENVIRNMYDRYLNDPPTYEEGFDEIVDMDKLDDSLFAIFSRT